MDNQFILNSMGHLSQEQADILMLYGFRQIKYFVEIDLPEATQYLPENIDKVQGINSMGRIQAMDSTGNRYGYFSYKNEWSKVSSSSGMNKVDLTEDFKYIHSLFNLQKWRLDELTYSLEIFFDWLNDENIN